MNHPFTKNAHGSKDEWEFRVLKSQNLDSREPYDQSDTVHFMSVFLEPNNHTCVIYMTQTKENERMIKIHRQQGEPENITNSKTVSLCKIKPVRS